MKPVNQGELILAQSILPHYNLYIILMFKYHNLQMQPSDCDECYGAEGNVSTTSN